MTLRPTAGEERAIEVARRANLDPGAATEWRVSSMPLRIGLFILVVIAVSAAAAFFGLVTLGFGGIPAHAAALAFAEMLVIRRRFFRTGIEEALWIAGAIGLATDAIPLMMMRGIEPGPWLILVSAAASMVAAVRLLNPLFALVGAAFLVGWGGVQFESGLAAAWITAAIAIAALVSLRLRFERPWIERACAWTFFIGPAAAWAIFRTESIATAILWTTAAAIVWIVLGIATRSRAAVAGGGLAALAAGFECLDAVAWPGEAKLLLAGLVMFGIAAGLERFLREPRRGFTSQAIDREDFGWPVELVTVAAVAPSAPPEGMRGEGGEFGGAGASEKY